jgi:hypothetical protein
MACAISRSRSRWDVKRLSARGATGPRRCGGTSPTGRGQVVAGPNARVETGPFLSASTVNTPVAIASATHWRPAASKARRQTGQQNTCRLPPSRRGVNPFPHHRQMVSVTVAGWTAICSRLRRVRHRIPSPRAAALRNAGSARFQWHRSPPVPARCWRARGSSVVCCRLSAEPRIDLRAALLPLRSDQVSKPSRQLPG